MCFYRVLRVDGWPCQYSRLLATKLSDRCRDRLVLGFYYARSNSNIFHHLTAVLSFALLFTDSRENEHDAFCI